MSTDRELLELAAKAAGISLHIWGTPGSENFADLDAAPFGRLWNPLTDDGDALRLAVKLRICTLWPMVKDKYAQVGAGQVGSALPPHFEPLGIDDDAAARRAIVRAAAELGKAMP